MHRTINHLEKHTGLLAEAERKHDMTQQKDASMMMRNDAEHLMILGEILGEDGVRFTNMGEFFLQKLFSTYNLRMIDGFRASTIELWKDRETLSDNEAEGLYPARLLSQEMPNSARATLSWRSDLLRLGSSETAKKCAFCGTGQVNGEKLLACVNCKETLYCDKICQRMSWKKEHKKQCHKVAADTKTKESQEEEQQGGKSSSEEGPDDGDGSEQ
jgi:hypothetical protein